MSGADSAPDLASPRGVTLGRRDGLRIAVATILSAASGYVVLAVATWVLPSVQTNTHFVTFWSTLFACFGLLSGMSTETTRAVAARQPTSGPAEGRAEGRAKGPRVLMVGLGVGAAGAALLAATSPVWAPRLFPERTAWLAALVCIAVAAYAAHSVVVGALAGRRAWRTYSRLIAADSLARLGLVVIAALALGTLVGLTTAAAVAAFTWAVYLLLSGSAREAASSRADSDLGTFLRRILAASFATGASALLVVGFPILLSLTTSPAAYGRAAPLLLAITLTRAPLMIPLNAYQGVAVTHFVQHRSRGLAALVPIVRAVVALGLTGTLLAWLVGPWLLEVLLRYHVSGPVLAALTAAATVLALLTLTGALCQALTLHRGFVTGWGVALLTAVLILLLPMAITPRAVLALAVGPLAGVLVHLWLLRRHAGAPAAPVGPEPHLQEVGPAVSVCMATYNGAAYVEEQLASVLTQLGDADEVVVVDDGSSDDTVAMIRAVGDPRVRVLESDQNAGYVRAFERALTQARGDYLLLCDQDDVWRPGRVAAMVEALADAHVVAANLGTLGGEPRIRGPYGQEDWHLRAAHSRRHRGNIVGVLIGNRPYYGSAMGLRREALTRVLPFPAFLVESHDLWIALYGNLARSITHLELRVTDRRLHTSNASTAAPRAHTTVVRSRILLVRSLRELRRRVRRDDESTGGNDAQHDQHPRMEHVEGVSE